MGCKLIELVTIEAITEFVEHFGNHLGTFFLTIRHIELASGFSLIMYITFFARFGWYMNG